MINMLVDQTVIIDAPKAVLELLDDLKLLLIEHKITEEEFAVLYGYIYLARESLMTVEDVQFIMANTVGH